MPTNSERREVAAKLRDMAVRTNPSWPALMEALGTPGRSVTVQYLADLIELEERTCHMHRDEHGTWHCGNCDDSYRNGEGIVPWYDSWEPDFCPDCGARVIADE